METAIRNIIQNAYEAIHEKGKISIQTELNHVDSNIDSSSADKNKHKSFLEISVKDTGIGISNNNKGKIFEPFFSTKKKGYCNGLGLSIADRLIKQLNGHITFQSESEQGTEIVIHLPIAEDSNNSQININDIRNEKTCNSVLVIDDDQSIREMATIMLNRLGCSVRCCEDGEKGYSYFLANHSKIDLIILDLIMPNLSGNECFYKLREVDSNIPIIICSGFSEQKIVQELHLYNAVYFLQKPFSFKNLSNAVAEIVSEK
jgi:CheY-like chemotaxis protein/anti-sigma regulatory factor (Ser/Thr protein kinase)